MALYRNVRTLFLEQGDDRDTVLLAAEELLVAKGAGRSGATSSCSRSASRWASRAAPTR